MIVCYCSHRICCIVRHEVVLLLCGFFISRCVYCVHKTISNDLLCEIKLFHFIDALEWFCKHFFFFSSFCSFARLVRIANGSCIRFTVSQRSNESIRMRWNNWPSRIAYYIRSDFFAFTVNYGNFVVCRRKVSRKERRILMRVANDDWRALTPTKKNEMLCVSWNMNACSRMQFRCCRPSLSISEVDSCEKKTETSTIIIVVECKSFASVDGSEIASHAK